MSIMELLPLTLPAVLVVGAALLVASRARHGRDVVIDLREVPTVRLADERVPTAPGEPLRPADGALVVPAGNGSLGARLWSSAADDGQHMAPGHPRTVVVRRRQRPLVAVSRESSAS